MLSVFIVDDEPMVRRGLKKLIDWDYYGFELVGESANGVEALENILPDKVDVVITDLRMNSMDGIELSAKLKERYPAIRIIVLTGFDEFTLVQQSMRNGVVDYLLKPVDEKLLIESLLRVKKQIEDERFPYPFEIESLILSKIGEADAKGMLEALDGLFEEFYKYKVPFDILKRICKLLLTAIDRYLECSGSNLKDLTGNDITGINYLDKYDSKDEIKFEMVSVMTGVIEHKMSLGNKKAIEQIKDYIKANINEDISLNLLASKFYLNPSYISQIFKGETGQNYTEYISGLRIEKAMKLLNDQNLRVHDISEMVGYGDPKYFSELFKRLKGVSPAEYRKRLLSKE
jgi:two-component system response regulator YesN